MEKEFNQQRKKIAIWLCMIVLFFCAAGMAYALIKQLYVPSTFGFLLAIAGFIASAILIKRDHPIAAYFIGIGTIFIQLGILEVLDREGVAFQMSLIIMCIGVVFTLLLLPAKYSFAGFLFNVLLGNAISLLDYLAVTSRPYVDILTSQIMLGFALILAAIIIALSFRLWANLSFSVKLVVSLLITATISIASINAYIVISEKGYLAQMDVYSFTSQMESIEALIHRHNQMVVVIGNAIGLLAVLLGQLLANLTVRDLVKTVVEVDEIAQTGDLEKSISARSLDEIGKLGQSIERLLDYIRSKAGTAIRLSEGDLTENVQKLSDRDTLGNAFVQMLGNLNQALSLVSHHAAELKTASDQLAATAGNSGTATNQIADTIQQIASGITQESESAALTSQSVDQMARAIEGVARGAEDQSNAVNKTSEVTSVINENIEKVVNGIKIVGDQSLIAQEAANNGQKVMQTNLEGMNAIKDQVILSSGKVEEMGNLSNNIGVILETITDIASQTNLLALNAAIEAARAGEAGKGFAVVADEVRKLAERSGSATKEIDQLVQTIQKAVEEAVSAMQKSNAEVDRGVEYSNQANHALTQIIESIRMVKIQSDEVNGVAEKMRLAADELTESVERVSAVVEENTAATEEMSAGSQMVVESIQNISSVSEENSAAIEEVSASTEELTAQAKEVAELANATAGIAVTLNEAVSKFQLAIE